MIKQRKKAISMFLVLCMILSSLPMVALAQENAADSQQPPVTIQQQGTETEIEVPKAKQGLVYNGEKQIGVEKSEGYTLSGNISETFAGQYTAVATLKPNFKWKGVEEAQSNSDQTIQWSIASATRELDIDESKDVYLHVPSYDLTKWVKISEINPLEVVFDFKEKKSEGKHKTSDSSIVKGNQDHYYFNIDPNLAPNTKIVIVATLKAEDFNGDHTPEYKDAQKEITLTVKEKPKAFIKNNSEQKDNRNAKYDETITLTAEVHDSAQDSSNRLDLNDTNKKWAWNVVPKTGNNFNPGDMIIHKNENSIQITVKKVKDFQVELDYESDQHFAKMDTLSFTVQKADQKAPTGLTVKKPTSSTNNDGKIIHTSDKMEYTTDETVSASSQFISCANDQTVGLASGTYNVRYKGDENYNPSPVTKVVIPTFDSKTAVQKPTERTFTYNGKTITAYEANENAGYKLVNEVGFNNSAKDVGKFKVKFQPNDGYEWDDKTTNPIEVEWYIKAKALTKDDLAFSNITKVYDGSKDTNSSFAVKVKKDVIDDEPRIVGNALYNSENVKAANKIIFTPTAISSGNYTITATKIEITDAAITKANQAALPAFELTFTKNNDNKTFTATIPKVAGAEYSFDGASFSDVNTKNNCQADTQYTGYIRKKADDNHNPGNVTQSTKKSPKLSPNSGNSGNSGGSNNSGGAGNSNISNNSNNAANNNVSKNNVLVSNSEKQQQAALEKLTKNVKAGATLNINLDAKAKVFAKSLEQLANKDVTLQLKAGEVTWEINTKDIPKGEALEDLKLGVKLNSNTIPQSAIKESFGDKKPLQMKIDHDGYFGFTMHLNMNVGAKHKGLFANVYYYNLLTKKNEFQSAHQIDAKGNIKIPFEHASSYAILVDSMSHEKTNDNTKDSMKEMPKQTFENKFTDVKASDWFFEAVKYMNEKGFMAGVSEAQFDPNASTSRAMIVTILHRLVGTPKAMSKHSFQDVNSGAYYENALNWAVENKIVKGYDEHKFAPNDAMTREQFAVMLLNFAKTSEIELMITPKELTFADADSVSPWAKDALIWANETAIVKGDNNMLNPKQNATRAEAATMIMRFMQAFFTEAVPY